MSAQLSSPPNHRSFLEFFKFKESLLILSIAAFLPYFASGMIAAFIMVWLRRLGASFLEVGVVNAFSNLALAISFLAGGTLSDSYGGKKVFFSGLVLTLFSTVLYGVAGLVFAWVLVAFGLILGRVAVGFRETSSFSIIYDVAEERRRATSFGLLSTFRQMGYVVGPSVGGLIAYLVGLRGPFLLAPPLVFVAILLTSLKLELVEVRPARLRFSLQEIKEVLASSPGVASLILISLWDQFFLEMGNPFYMIFLDEEFKAPHYMLGLCFTVMSASTLAFSMVGGISSDIARRRKPFIVLGAVLMALSVGLVAFAVDPWMFVASYFLAGVSTAISNTAIPSYFTDALRERASTIFGLRLGLMYIVGTFAPPISGWLIQEFGSLRMPFLINFVGSSIEIFLLAFFFKESLEGARLPEPSL